MIELATTQFIIGRHDCRTLSTRPLFIVIQILAGIHDKLVDAKVPVHMHAEDRVGCLDHTSFMEDMEGCDPHSRTSI